MKQNLRVNKTNFQMKGFALGLALKQRRKATWKSPIENTAKSVSENASPPCPPHPPELLLVYCVHCIRKESPMMHCVTPEIPWYCASNQFLMMHSWLHLNFLEHQSVPYCVSADNTSKEENEAQRSNFTTLSYELLTTDCKKNKKTFIIIKL